MIASKSFVVTSPFHILEARFKSSPLVAKPLLIFGNHFKASSYASSSVYFVFVFYLFMVIQMRLEVVSKARRLVIG